MAGKKFFFLLLFLSALIEGTFLFFPLTAVLTALFLIVFPEVSLAFWAGIFLDIFAQGRWWGGSSLFFLGVFLLVKRYRQKIHLFHPLSAFFFLAGVVALYGKIFYQRIGFWPWEGGVLGVFLLFFLFFLFPEMKFSGKKLAV